MNTREKRKLYFDLYSKAQRLFNKYQPCKGCTTYCCQGCRFLSKKGCTIKSLDCKLWLCMAKIHEKPELYKELRELANVALEDFLINRNAPKWAKDGWTKRGKIVITKIKGDTHVKEENSNSQS